MSAAPAIKSRLKYRLKIISGPHQNEIHTLDKDVIKIGRGDDNTIQLPRDARISRNHIEIEWNGAEFSVKNLSQKNFVMVNERVVQMEVIKPGTKIQIGETLIEVFEDGPILVPKNSALPPSTSGQQVQVSAPAPQVAPVKVVPASAYPAPTAVPKSQAAAKMKQSVPQFKATAKSSSKTIYYIAGAIILLVLWLASQDSKPKEKMTFRTSQQVEYDRLQVETEKQKLVERVNGQNNQLVRQSQENMVKGMRDFQQGNYIRARENFASVLIKDPENELAKRYYHLSGIKFDELLQFNILQGLRYREKKNYRLCRSSFQAALIMIQNNNRHAKYKEIKDYFDECNLSLEGRF